MSSERTTPWHPRFNACQGCGQDERPHIAKGLCERCYRKARLAERGNQPAPTLVTEAAPGKRGWHQEYASCQVCGKAHRPHHHGGICVDCYRNRNRLGERGHEELPVYQGQRQAPTPIMSRQGRAAQESHPCAPADATAAPGARAAMPITVQCASMPEGLTASADTPAPLTASADMPIMLHTGQGHTQEDTVIEGGTARHEPAAAIDALASVKRPRAPRLYPRHITVIRTYVITCPNCGETVTNGRTGQGVFHAEDVAAGTEVACHNCDARWEVAVD